MVKQNKKIKIGILAPLFLQVPPKKQGGTEWICYHQANGLVKRGYDVTLFAVKGSKTSAKLVPILDRGVSEYTIDLKTMEASRKLRLEMVSLGLAFTEMLKHNFDIVFNHARGGEAILPLTKFYKTPIATILHLPIFKEFAELYKIYNAPLISISLNQRLNFPNLNYVGNVYNGVDTKIFSFNPRPQDYLLLITTIGEHKNTLDAILAAKKAGQKFIIAGKIRDQKYFEQKIKPLIDGKQIKYLGEIGLKEKINLYKNAKGFLFPSIWNEPFGLVMIESLACGTPVIAFKNAAVPEIVIDKKTGFIVPKNNIEKMAAAIKKIGQIDRRACRQAVEDKFSLDKMIDGYEQVIKKLLGI